MARPPSSIYIQGQRSRTKKPLCSEKRFKRSLENVLFPSGYKYPHESHVVLTDSHRWGMAVSVMGATRVVGRAFNQDRRVSAGWRIDPVFSVLDNIMRRLQKR
jgi:hypothetical protein